MYHSRHRVMPPSTRACRHARTDSEFAAAGSVHPDSPNDPDFDSGTRRASGARADRGASVERIILDAIEHGSNESSTAFR